MEALNQHHINQHNKAMKHTLFTTALLFLLALPLSAAVTVTGTVFDSNNEPVIGASVLEQGTTNGTVTDFDGQFILEVANANATLVVSYVGMKTANVALAGKTSVRVILQEDAEVIDEVVVIGYGTQKKRDVTTAISSVDTENLEKPPITSAAQAMQGKAAGVTVVKPNGQPGTGMVVRVRGTTSMNASNDPLYVVDQRVDVHVHCRQSWPKAS